MSAFKDKALPFIRSYGLLIGLGLAALVALPTAFYFSHQMNLKHVADLQAEITKDYDAVTKADVSYALPGPGGEKVLEKKAPYNAELIAYYAETWKTIKDRSAVVWEQGLKFNKADHAVLIPGVFPAPAALEGDVKIRELIGAVIEFHKKLLANAKAGSPPDQNTLTEQIREHRTAYLERLKAQSGTAELDDAAKKKLTQELIDVRVDRTRRRAMELGVYADASIFEGIPTEVPTDPPTLAEAWELQEHSWVNADVIRAIAAANQSSQTGVPGALVKRILKIAVDLPAYDPANPTPQPFDAGEEKVPVDPAGSLTGRISGPGTKNKWYDLRRIELEIIVSSARLPEFVDALSSTNLFSVLETDLTAVPVREHLRSGYHYGDEHVVRALLTLELVHLREWRKDWMPAEVKQALAMDDKVQPSGDAGGAPGGVPGRPAPGGAGGAGGGPRRPTGGKAPN